MFDRQLTMDGREEDCAPVHEQPRMFEFPKTTRGQLAFDPIGAALYTLPLSDRQYHAACAAFRALRALGSRACGDSCLAVERGPVRRP